MAADPFSTTAPNSPSSTNSNPGPLPDIDEDAAKVLAAMQERAEKIADGLAAADRASHDLELAQEKAVERLKEAKEEATRLLA